MEVREPSAKYLARPAFKQSPVGPIPFDWTAKLLCNVAQIRTGIAKNSNVLVANPVAVYYLRVANVQDGFLDLSEMSQLLVSRDDVKHYSVEPGDVLMNEGGDLDKLGRGSVWRGSFAPCVHQNHVFVVRCKQGLLPDFLSEWTRSVSSRRYFLTAGKQTTNLASINKASLGLLPVAIPSSVVEQQSIATALSDADALIEALEQLLTKKRQIKQGAMQELLTGKSRLPGFEGEWTKRSMGDLLSIRHGKSQKEVEVVDGPYPILATGGQIGTASRFLYDRPSVLIGRKGTINQPQFMDTPFWTVDTLFYSEVNAPSSAKFLFYRFCLIDWMQYNEASGVPSLNARTIEAVEILCPDPDEQAAIATVLSDMDAEIAALEARLAKARAIKQGMMQELLTGRIRLV